MYCTLTEFPILNLIFTTFPEFKFTAKVQFFKIYCQLLVPDALYFLLLLTFCSGPLIWLWVIVCVPIVSRHCYSIQPYIRPMARLWFFTWPDRGWHGIRHLEQLQPQQMQNIANFCSTIRRLVSQGSVVRGAQLMFYVKECTSIDNIWTDIITDLQWGYFKSDWSV